MKTPTLPRIPPSLIEAGSDVLHRVVAPLEGVHIALLCTPDGFEITDRKSTRLNSSHLVISYAVFCLKKKKQKTLTADLHTWKLQPNVRADSAMMPHTVTS